MLRRPLLICVAAFAAGIAVYHYAASSSEYVPVFLAAVTPAAGLLFLFCRFFLNDENDRRKCEKVAFLLAVFLLSGALMGAWSLGKVSQFEPFMDRPDVVVQLQGRVVRAESIGEEDLRVVLSMTPDAACLCSGEQFYQKRERILLTISHCTLKPASMIGTVLLVEGTVQRPAGASNPKTFDYSLYLRSEKIFCTMKAGAGQILEQTGPEGIWKLFRDLLLWKYRYEETVCAVMGPETGGTLCAVLFGDDHYLDESLRESFGENGIGHLLAASGLHTGFVYAILYVLFRRPSTLKGNLPILAFLGVYALLAELSASVVRAVLMIGIRIVGKTAFRRVDFLTCLALAAGILLLYEPAYLFSSGFQLSFIAVLALAVVLPGLERILLIAFPGKKSGDDAGDEPPSFREKAAEGIRNTLTGTAAIQMGMAPATLQHFHYFSPGGLLLNMPAIGLAGIIVPFGIVLMPLTILWNALPAGVFQSVTGCFLNGLYRIDEMLVHLLLVMNQIVADSGAGCRYCPSPAVSVLLAYYAILFLLLSEMGAEYLRHGGRRRTAGGGLVLLAILLLCAGAGVLADGPYRDAEMVFVDVGQGDCAHLKADGADLLFDSGGSAFRDVGKDTLMPYFLGNGVADIDVAVISHLHTDHYAGLCTLKDYVPVHSLMLSAAYRSLADRIAEETGVDKDHMMFVERGDRFRYHGVELEVLAPEHRSEEEFARLALDEEEENNCSLVVRTVYRGRSFLITGDISSELERHLKDDIPEWLPCDVLKTPHHGSRYSSCIEFLETADPQICVIQVGARNVYGHPAEEVLERMNSIGCRIFRTDRQGAVMMDLDEGIRVYTMK